jgi:NAD(P)-dependent dehydrogenase (short-subunit alcohol dehydrogenase family)
MPLAIVTGSNRGIGLEFVRQIRARDVAVLAACRESSEALRQLGAEVVDGVDVATDAGIARLARAAEGRRVDLLVNNAGIGGWATLADLDADLVRRQFEVNALGPLRVTRALLGNLGAGSKVAVVTSRMGSIGDNSSGGHYGYRMSKAALNIAAKSLSVDLKPKGVAVAVLHPGFVQTDMVGGRGEVTPAHAVRGMMARIDGLSLENTGTFWHAQGEVLPW